MHNPSKEFCCPDMQAHIEGESLHFHYDPKLREYGIRYADDGIRFQLIQYCPWCGSQLPASLREVWFDELDRLELEPEDPMPDELQDDRWWHKCPRSP